MFLADDEIIYTKSDLTIDYNNKNNNGPPRKGQVCHFFIPKVVCKVNKNENNNTHFLKCITNEENVSTIDTNPKHSQSQKSSRDSSVNGSICSPVNSSHGSFDKNDNAIVLANLNKNLSLISKPMPKRSFSRESQKREKKFSNSSPSINNYTDTISILTPLNNPPIFKLVLDLCNSDQEDNSNTISDSPKTFINVNTKLSNPTNVPPSSLTSSIPTMLQSHESISSSSCSNFIANSSDIKGQSSITGSHKTHISCDEYQANSPSPSSSSSIRTLHVDMDNEISQIGKSSERLLSKEPQKRKSSVFNDQMSVNSSSNSGKRSRNSIVGQPEGSDNVRRTKERLMESDEETEPAVYEKNQKVSSTSKEPRITTKQDISIVNEPPKFSIWNSSTENDRIYCFDCKIDSNTFCNEHPIDKILNLNIECPFVEYLMDRSYDKFIDESIDTQDCNCKQNELDHIQQSLPCQFQLRESELFEIGVWTKVSIIQGTIMGPYLGEIVEQYKAEMLTVNRYKTRGTSKSSYFSPCIEFAFKSNWLRCISFTNNHNRANLQVLHYDNKVFFQAKKNIDQDQELLVFNEVRANIAKEILLGEDVAYVDGEFNVKLPVEEDYTIRSDEELNNIPYNGTKYSKEMIIDIARIWRSQPQMTVVETLKIIGQKHPDARTISERYLSRITRKYQLRHKGGANVKFDSQMKEFVRLVLLKFPNISTTEVNEKLRERFPLRTPIDNDNLNNIIDSQYLRPSREICQIMNRVMNRGTMRTRTSTAKYCSTKATVVTKPDTKPVVHRPKLPNNKPYHRNDTNLIDNIRLIVKVDPFKHIDQITNELKRRFPKDKLLDIATVKSLMKSQDIPFNHHFMKKIDDEMKKFICNTRMENPHFSAAKINRLLRKFLPEKPYVEQNAIYLVLRKFNLTNAK